MDTAAPRTPRHHLTTLTSALMVLVTLPFARSAADLLRAAFAPQLDLELRLSLISYQLDPGELGLFLKLGAILMAVFCVAALVVAAGVFLRSETARTAGMVLFAFLGVVSFLLGLGALTADPRPDGWVLAVLTGPVNLAVLGLLVSRPVADDVARGSFYRKRSRTRSRDRLASPSSG